MRHHACLPLAFHLISPIQNTQDPWCVPQIITGQDLDLQQLSGDSAIDYPTWTPNTSSHTTLGASNDNHYVKLLNLYNHVPNASLVALNGQKLWFHDISTSFESWHITHWCCTFLDNFPGFPSKFPTRWVWNHTSSPSVAPQSRSSSRIAKCIVSDR